MRRVCCRCQVSAMGDESPVTAARERARCSCAYPNFFALCSFLSSVQTSGARAGRSSAGRHGGVPCGALGASAGLCGVQTRVLCRCCAFRKGQKCPEAGFQKLGWLLPWVATLPCSPIPSIGSRQQHTRRTQICTNTARRTHARTRNNHARLLGLMHACMQCVCVSVHTQRTCSSKVGLMPWKVSSVPGRVMAVT